MKLLVSTLVLVFAGFAQAELKPNLDEIPEYKPDLGMVERLGNELFQACMSDYSRVLKKTTNKPSEIQKRARNICFCIVKDTKHRQDTDELRFLLSKYRDQIDDDAELTEDQDLYLHNNDNTEANCRLNPQYRFGDVEPTMIDNSKQTSSGAKNASPKNPNRK